MGVHLLVLPFKMGIYRKRNVHCIGSSLVIAWVSATKQASHTHKLFTLWREKGTEKLAPIICAHAVAEEGHRLACSCLLCPL